MALILHRIVREAHAENMAQLLSGEGGRRSAGRWHERGMPVAYFSSSRALGWLETLAHLSAPVDAGPRGRVAATLEMPDDLSHSGLVRTITHEEIAVLDPDWTQPGNDMCRNIGAQWFEDGTHLGLTVPSAIIPLETNTILNCTHPAITDLLARPELMSVSDATLDPRIAEVIDLSRRSSS